jgi:chloramphenicol 3-O-phosphotransferase
VVPAPVVVLNGPPRSGKSSIAAALGDPWVGVGVDLFGRSVVPRRFRPGIGLRPGGEQLANCGIARDAGCTVEGFRAPLTWPVRSLPPGASEPLPLE